MSDVGALMLGVAALLAILVLLLDSQSRAAAALKAAAALRLNVCGFNVVCFALAQGARVLRQGSYFADDAGKIDQYCVTDERYVRGTELHSRLYPSQSEGERHPGRVLYGLVCRVALGHTVYFEDKGEGCFAPHSNRREVSNPLLFCTRLRDCVGRICCVRCCCCCSAAACRW